MRVVLLALVALLGVAAAQMTTTTMGTAPLAGDSFTAALASASRARASLSANSFRPATVTVTALGPSPTGRDTYAPGQTNIYVSIELAIMVVNMRLIGVAQVSNTINMASITYSARAAPTLSPGRGAALGVGAAAAVAAAAADRWL